MSKRKRQNKKKLAGKGRLNDAKRLAAIEVFARESY